jgi:hypothetical protein
MLFVKNSLKKSLSLFSIFGTQTMNGPFSIDALLNALGVIGLYKSSC